jgi:predicted DNA binding CopG/RHH family protein
MKIKKKNIIKLIESYILEQDEEKQSSDLIKLDDFVVESNSAKFMLNYDKKNIDVVIEKTDTQLKKISGKEAAGYLNVALVYVYDKKDIKKLVKMCKIMKIIKDDINEESIVKSLENKVKPNERSLLINNVFKQDIYNQSKSIAQNIINDNLN